MTSNQGWRRSWLGCPRQAPTGGRSPLLHFQGRPCRASRVLRFPGIALNVAATKLRPFHPLAMLGHVHQRMRLGVLQLPSARCSSTLRTGSCLVLHRSRNLPSSSTPSGSDSSPKTGCLWFGGLPQQPWVPKALMAAGAPGCVGLLQASILPEANRVECDTWLVD